MGPKGELSERRSAGVRTRLQNGAYRRAQACISNEETAPILDEINSVRGSCRQQLQD